MKKKYTLVIINVTIILMVIVILSVLLYPTVSNYINSRSQSRAVAHYVDDVAAMSNDNKKAMLEAAREYNSKLLQNGARFEYTEEDTAEYKKQLNTGRGIMGILTIDKIGVNLAIYHGSDEGVLQVGLGHMQGTSLPVGGIGTHAFITGHRGLPSSTLLTDLDEMTEGDVFVLFVMGQTMTYEVDQIRTVLPQEVNAVSIDKDQDYCTLVTCTPYGINSHRLLVRGHRVANALDTGAERFYADAQRLDKTMVILLFILPVIPILIIYIVIRLRKIHRGGNVKK